MVKMELQSVILTPPLTLLAPLLLYKGDIWVEKYHVDILWSIIDME